MRNFRKKRGWKNIARSKPVLALLAVLVLFFAWQVLGFMRKMQITIENRKIAEDKVAELEKEKEKLSADIAKLKTGEGVEASIRDKFGLVKEGEGVIVVLDDKTAPTAPKPNSGGFFSFLFFWRNWGK
ncbi:hypothetical protein A2643_02505 [Candidatus Nomurabacteria bacterium RIFCSPHIGHO2_01_FULL_39_220]|uniref:Cell division protein FtsL n=1 Tax=Candidatus Nomurabacteria bacterium RIFCSPLOWO2_02_FULL_40_67 TaxID=1801787 RepID=A0A1F6Y5X6_9BACT|nr:MAG: hypothetical protein UU01_C0008G0019 [Parcubacteria group bacterium GW2011_GWA2_40_37]KKS16263.1 MAG: hypothetical protein UU71_C0005G0013 [Parcubacteria group bacterium GW2011_GWB1_41_6]KKS70987.1 MAG: hypothetical protein UV43_C0047G0004 [Parcubacteria group bacterium GW2011_GWF2_42_7]OGI63243.1 MAG: hypothetical protein A2W12_00855 [Candidatus Nomurabacteria bacterium RBG_16_40_11]OGI70770.1 MAG: hypothetical protein A2643_02505 [Candidatus Nomurabacteria bacterium RIFCSPHIGHO2_01_FU